jgi:hypothetical protein
MILPIILSLKYPPATTTTPIKTHQYHSISHLLFY